MITIYKYDDPNIPRNILAKAERDYPVDLVMVAPASEEEMFLRVAELLDVNNPLAMCYALLTDVIHNDTHCIVHCTYGAINV